MDGSRGLRTGVRGPAGRIAKAISDSFNCSITIMDSKITPG